MKDHAFIKGKGIAQWKYTYDFITNFLRNSLLKNHSAYFKQTWHKFPYGKGGGG